MQPLARRLVHLIRIVFDEPLQHLDRDFLWLILIQAEIHEHLGFLFFDIVTLLIVEVGIEIVFEWWIHLLQDHFRCFNLTVVV